MKRPQTNGICERFHKTVLNEFFRVAFRRRIYRDVGQKPPERMKRGRVPPSLRRPPRETRRGRLHGKGAGRCAWSPSEDGARRKIGELFPTTQYVDKMETLRAKGVRQAGVDRGDLGSGISCRRSDTA